MKKNRGLLAFIVVLCMLLESTVFAAKAESIYSEDIELVMQDLSKVGYFQAEDTVLENVPYIDNGIFMIPAKYLFESYGYTVSEENGAFTAQKGSTFLMTKDKKDITVDGVTKTLTANITEKNGELFVPQDICDLLGLKYRVTEKGIFAVSKSGKFEGFNEVFLEKLQGIYVSVDGKATAAGKANDPVNDLEAAKAIAIKYIREYGKRYSVRIFVMGGTYRFDNGVEFTEDEFSLDTYKGISIESYNDIKPEFTASVEIDAEKFIPVTDGYTLSRIHRDGRGKVASIDLRELGISKLEQVPNRFYYLYLNDIEQTNARWPNIGESTIFSVPQENTFTFAETDPTRWTEAKNAYVFGHFSSRGYEWHQGIIQSVDAQTKTITIKGAQSSNVLKTTAAGTVWYAANLLEELDTPGEWFVDTDELKLYYYPPYNLKEQKLEMTKYLGTLITFNDAKNVSIKGINFSKCGQAINFAGTNIDGVNIEKCNFSHGQADPMIGFKTNAATKCYNVNIVENTVYNIFGKFTQFRAGNLNTLEHGNCVIKNNHLAQTAQYYKSAGGMVGTYQTENNGNVGVICENNIVQDIPGGAALGWAGTDCTINNNEVVNAGKVMSDYGAIYFGRSSSYNNMEVANNFLHNFNNSNNYNALYNDDAFANANWHHNMVVDMYQPCIQAPGINTKYMYNVAVNCAKPGSIGSRKSYNDWIYYGGLNWTHTNKLIYENEEVYRNAYPKMFDDLERDKEFYNVCWDSIYYGNVGIGTQAFNDFVELTEYGAKEMERNGKTMSLDGLNGQVAGNPTYDYSDDLFVDVENMNYNINPESQLAKDFPELLEIDVTKSGLTPEAEYLLEEPEQGSHLKYPSNGQKNINASSITFSWDPVKGASFYRIIVATDPKLENVVYDKEIRENGNTNQITLEGFSNNCLYYWKVVAKSVVRQNMFEIDSIGGPYAFKTAVTDKVSKENMRLAITAFEEFCNVDLQNPEYEFDKDFVENAKTKLEEFKTVYKKASKQEELDQAEDEIYFIMKKSPFYMKVSFSNLSNAYSENAPWEIDNGEITVDADGVVSFSDTVEQRGNAKIKVNNPNSVLCFKMKLSEWGTTGSTYQGFDVKLTDAGKGYLVVFKKDVIEWQRINRTLVEIPNDFVEADKWYDVQAGGINTPNGVFQFLRIDGRIVYAELDQTADQTRDGGYFRIRKSPFGGIQIKDAENIPQDSVMIDDILQNFREPHSAKHLQSLLIGSADTMEMGSSILFSKLDKAKLAEVMYPVITSKDISVTRDDISEYKKTIEEMSVISGYNQGLSENLFKNKIDFLYKDVIGIDSIDTNDVNIYSEYLRLPDKFKAVTTDSMMNADCKSIEELRLHIAKCMFTGVINACMTGYAGQSEYISDVLTKANADYIGIDISDYLALSPEQKLKANDAIGNGRNGDTSRTLDILVEDIHEAVKNAK